jgi:hypothetical protein
VFNEYFTRIYVIKKKKRKGGSPILINLNEGAQAMLQVVFMFPEYRNIVLLRGA